MKEFKGTPGPWIADKTSRAVGPISHDDDQSYGMVIPVAWVEFDPEVEIQASNQNLIAAAPDLLEALQGMIQAHKSMIFSGHERIIELGGSCDSPEAMISSNPDIRKAQAAINKALGE